MKKIFLAILLIFLISGGAIWIFVVPKAPILSGYSARIACTCHFVQNMSMSEIMDEDLSQYYFMLNHIKIDDSNRYVTSSTLGFHPKTAVYREGQGCILLEEEDDYHVVYDRLSIVDTFQWHKKNIFSENEMERLDELFFSGGIQGDKMTKAALIIHKDSIVYEKYGEGVDQDMPLLGWSMTKSVTGTLIGMLIDEGVLSIHQSHLFKDWTDERRNITIDQLLNMKSGLDWEEKYDKVSVATKMLFDRENVVQFATSLGVEAQPGTFFEYSSGTTNLLSGIIRNEMPDLNTYLNFPYNKLFKPLGMSTAFIETDESGNMIGSSFMYASARDWAKYGMLYLHDGEWEGKQVISRRQVYQTFQSDPVSEGNYGFHFWHNDGAVFPNCPKDLIYASGYLGQRIVILPDQDLIIVRLGLRKLDFDKIISTIVQYIEK